MPRPKRGPDPVGSKVNLKPYYKALKGKAVPIMQSIHWVANNLDVPIEEFKHDEPPSYFAVILLEWANQGNKTLFLKEFMTKAIPTKTQLETEEKLRDDGRALEILLKFQKEFDEADSPPRPGIQHPLPPGVATAGGDEQDGEDGDQAGLRP